MSYEEAICRLEYIELIKTRLIRFFLELVKSPKNDIYLDKSVTERTIAGIAELIDELFYEEFCVAMRVKQAFEVSA